MFHHDTLTILKSKRIKGMHGNGTFTVKQHALLCGVIGFSVLILECTVTLQLRFIYI